VLRARWESANSLLLGEPGYSSHAESRNSPIWTKNETVRLVPEPPLDPVEQIAWKLPLGMTLGGTVVGGNLYLTGSRLLFVPNKLNLRTRNPRSIPLSEIVSIGKQKRSWTPYNGGMRIRLRVDLRGGPPVLFVLPANSRLSLDDVIEQLSEQIGTTNQRT
jgi:hypothetical protein